MSLIAELRTYCLAKSTTSPHLVWIPQIWNQVSYLAVRDTRSGEIQVDAYAFTAAILDTLLEMPGVDVQSDVDLDASTIYTALIRYTSAWYYSGGDEIETGTFLRTIWLIPMLRKMGVDILYLLPVTKNSHLNMKGDLPSPYTQRAAMALDAALHDQLVDDLATFTLDDQFTVLVQACHQAGIRVVHDLIPRVIAMDADFIDEHPDWIYWIQKDALDGFAPPPVPELAFFEECTTKNVDTVYTSAATASHLAKFSLPPDQLEPDRWHRLLARADGNVTDLVKLVESEMGIVPAPAHSDWINDVQPIWTDITFLRLYLDVYPGITQHLPEGQPPYVLFDTIKCNRFPATEPNAALWNMLDESVRFQMKTYELDGFRVDIGHTLPPELLSRLFATMRENRQHPVIISEDLFNRNHELARDTGYNIMLGSGWNVMADLSWVRLREHVAELPDLKIHVFACAETPDTPRITSRPGGIRLSRMMAVFNGFLPNGVPFINTGLEVNEQQPLNCGLGDNTGGADVPRAFFNKMVINWRADSAMFDLLCATAQTRKRFADTLTAENFFLCDTAEPLLAFGFRSDSGVVLLLLNLDRDGDVAVELTDLVPDPVLEWDVLLDSAARQQTQSHLPKALHPQQALMVHGRQQERIASVSSDVNSVA